MPDDIDTPLPEEHCQNCDHPQSEPVNDIWKDPNVKAALKDGRPAEDIAVLSCPKCGKWGYYNQGQHFWCRFCKEGWYCCNEDEEPPTGRQYLWLDGFTSLADTVTVTTDGYDNWTPPRHNDQAEASGARGRPIANPDAPAAWPPARG